MIDIAEARKVYSRLGDDESRKIYECRLLCSLTGNDDTLFPMINKVRNRVTSDRSFVGLYEKLQALNEDIYIYGCGVYGKLLLELMPNVR